MPISPVVNDALCMNIAAALCDREERALSRLMKTFEASLALLWQFCRIFLENHALAHAQRNDISH